MHAAYSLPRTLSFQISKKKTDILSLSNLSFSACFSGKSSAWVTHCFCSRKSNDMRRLLMKRNLSPLCRSVLRFIDISVCRAMACFLDCFRARDDRSTSNLVSHPSLANSRVILSLLFLFSAPFLRMIFSILVLI